ncbi:MAG: recombination protein RecR [Patescibacteria group bacterium]|jgi:recombination protein RecR|nr:MAG: recombination protein RecR [Patescibacteria group bacterium]
MNTLPSPIVRLVEAFERLPGVGPKSAQRLAYHMLHAPREYIDSFAETLKSVKEKVRLCNQCFNISDEELCVVCRDSGRERHSVVVVEGPLDVLAFDKTGYKGLYHVLHGVIAPLQHIGPEQLYISQLLPRLQDGEVKELVLATNPTIEGEATAVYIQRLVRGFADLKVSRIARGLPVGADVEYADEVTLRRAFEGRSGF